MSEDSSLTSLSETVTSLFRLTSSVRDRFFAKKLEYKIDHLIMSRMELLSEENNQSSYESSFDKVIFGIDSIADSLQDMVYLKILTVNPDVLNVQKNLLVMKLQIIKNKTIRSIESAVSSKSEEIPRPARAELSTESRPKVKKVVRLNKNKKMIFDFIKTFPDSRTKDIIHEFSAVSDRTVKRNLVELLDGGLIKRRVENKAVYYSIIG